MAALILPDQRALFLHIPKTGGTYVERVIATAGIHTVRPKVGDEVTAIHPPLSSFVGQKFDLIFTVVRQPSTWLASWWAYQTRRGWPKYENGKWHPTRAFEHIRGDSFDDFFRNWIAGRGEKLTRMYEAYTGQVGSPVKVIFNERLKGGLSVVLTMLGCDGEKAVAAYTGHPKKSENLPEISPAEIALANVAEHGIMHRWYD